MSFLNPIALWGLLAISIPILIHLWNGKRGQTVAWAAMDFLSTVESRVSKGFNLENWLVLILRILLLVLLVFLLAQLTVLSGSGQKEKKVAHVIYGDQPLWEEFRFEIQQALERDESVILAGNPLSNITTLESLFESEWNTNSQLQTTLDKLPRGLDSLVFYVPNSASELTSRYFSLPVSPTIQLSQVAPVSKSILIKTQSTQNFKINETGVLDSVATEGGDMAEYDLSEDIQVWVQNSELEKEFIQAALESISEVYGIRFQFTDQMDSASLVFSNERLPKMESEKLYFVSNVITDSESSNQIILPDSLTFTDSELIRNGQLPEFIIENFLAHQGIVPKSSPLEISQLESRFLVKPAGREAGQANPNEWLFLLFLGTIGIERFFAMKQGI
ncbi:BatA domain-containing protein [Algoriphagus namhaensis]|uniref:BatA domain-containing protein n=1 Tax=Algoriphagus namhaensis TaxID=915353 RepID=A0ABV8AUU4_9BACT